MPLTESQQLHFDKLIEEERKYRIARAWQTGLLTYKLHSAQLLIYNTIQSLPHDIRDVVILCARRFGKSFLITLMAIEDCLRKPGCVIRVIGPELEQTLEIVGYNLDKITSDAPPGLIRPQSSRRRWSIGKSQLIIGGFDKKNVSKNFGKEADGIYTEEAGASRSEEFGYAMREVLSPQLLHSKSRFVHATTPPPTVDHIFTTEYIPRAQVSRSLFRFTIYQNPLLDDTQLEQAIADSNGLDTIAFRRNYLCEIVKDPSIVVLPSFSTDKHVRDLEIPRYAKWIVFGDTGGIRDKTWVGVGYFDFERAKLCVVDERVYSPNTQSSITTVGIRELIAQAPPDTLVAIDMPGQLQTDIRKDHNIDVDRISNKDHFDAAINQLELAFTYDKIEIHPRCSFLINSCEFGRFNNQRTDFLRTEFLGHCDALAGLMYGWRLVDKRTNPFPKITLNREEYFVLKKEEETELENVGKMFRSFM